MTNVETLSERFAGIPRIEETGPKRGYNGPRMTKRGRRTRLIHAVMCAAGLLPLLMKLRGAAIPPRLIAVGLGLIVPGGGFIACGGAATMLGGLYLCFFLWRKHAMRIQDLYGSFIGIAGYWLLGALGGLLADIPWLARFRLPPLWAYAAAIACAFALFVPYELKTRKMYALMSKARAERTAVFDQSIAELDAITSTPYEAGTQELDEEQIKAARRLLDVAVNRKEGDFSGFDWLRGLAEYRYQLSVFGYGLMLLHAKYLPNFTGYLKQAHRFLIKGYTHPLTCGYWAREALTGYWSTNPDPVVKANVMLSGWMMPVVAGYHDQYHDNEFERDCSINFQPYKDNPEETYNYSSKGIIDVLYRQYKNHEYPYMLIPCEPHVAFPTCNSFALLGMLIYDRDHGTHLCADFWDDLYDNISREFIEIDGSMALRRQYTYGLRHLPSSQLGFDPIADVNNYLHYLPVFPGLARRCYAQIRKHEVELRDGVAYIRHKPWDKVMNMFSRKPDPSLQIALLEMVAAEYGDTELVEGLRKAETMYLARSKEPGSFRFKNVNSQIMGYFAFARLCKKNYWSDVILRGMPETAFTGPVLSECAYPDVIPAKAASNGDDLDLVLYNGAEPGDFRIKIERLQPDTVYKINGGERTFTADSDGQAELYVRLDGRTGLYIKSASGT